MKLNYKWTIILGNIILILQMVSSCNLNTTTKDLKSNDISQGFLTEGNDNIITFYEVFRMPDREMLQFLRNLKRIEPFIPIFELDMGNYPTNVVGVTTDSIFKEEILTELVNVDSLASNAKLVWSRNKIYNQQTDETFYHLYMLKKRNETDEIKTSEIEEIEAQINRFINEPEVFIKLNKTGTNKWAKMTEKAYKDDRNYIAFVIDNSVYSCPYMASPLLDGYLSIIGFNSIKEAENLVKRIDRIKSR